MGWDDCIGTALCNNTYGGFTCYCLPGFRYNGTSCYGEKYLTLMPSSLRVRLICIISKTNSTFLCGQMQSNPVDNNERPVFPCIWVLDRAVFLAISGLMHT